MWTSPSSDGGRGTMGRRTVSYPEMLPGAIFAGRESNSTLDIYADATSRSDRGPRLDK